MPSASETMLQSVHDLKKFFQQADIQMTCTMNGSHLGRQLGRLFDRALSLRSLRD